jgi:hypothetical protein
LRGCAKVGIVGGTEFRGKRTGTLGRKGWRVQHVGKVGLGDKNVTFLAETLLNYDFMVVPPFWSLCNLTGGSSVRGKADPNWVRKVFNCLRSL